MNYLYYLIAAGLLAMAVAYSFQKSPVKESADLRIMSYNLRYDNPDDGVNAWDNRKERVTNVIQFYEPVFLGTQEGLLHQIEYLEQELEQYSWIGVGRDDGTMSGEFSALFFDTGKVELIDNSEQTIWLSETPSKPGKSWDAALPRILTYGKFRDRRSGNEFFVLNTHFDHIGDTARAKSAELIVNTIRDLASGEPVILTGDFNVTPDDEPYEIITESASGLKDAYEIADLPHTGPHFSFEGFEVKSGSEQRRIDFIFVNDQVKVKKHAIISTFEGDYYPSDHLPVIADVEVTEKGRD